VKHVHPISRIPSKAQGVDFVESLVLIIFTVLFQDFDNFPSIIQSLQKTFSKVDAF